MTATRLTRRAALGLGAAALLAPRLAWAEGPGMIIAGGTIHTGLGNQVEAVASDVPRLFGPETVVEHGETDDTAQRLRGGKRRRGGSCYQTWRNHKRTR